MSYLRFVDLWYWHVTVLEEMPITILFSNKNCKLFIFVIKFLVDNLGREIFFITWKDSVTIPCTHVYYYTYRYSRILLYLQLFLNGDKKITTHAAPCLRFWKQKRFTLSLLSAIVTADSSYCDWFIFKIRHNTVALRKKICVVFTTYSIYCDCFLN